MDEKCYISRDENDNQIWVWRKPSKGVWSPVNISSKDESVNYQREDRSLDNATCYTVEEFKKKFGITLNKKQKKCVNLPVDLLDSQDFRIFSSDEKRKRL